MVASALLEHLTDQPTVRTTSLLPRTARPRRALVALAVGASLVVAGCGDDDDPGTSPTTEDDGTTTTSSSTTEATTTTTAPSDEDEVRELVMGYATYLERLGNPNDPNDPLIAEMFTDPARSRIVDIVTRNAVDGSYYEGSYEMAILGVSLDGDAGVVRTCSHDLITKRAADGSAQIPPEPEPFELDFQVRRTDDGWRIAETTPYAEETCSLD